MNLKRRTNFNDWSLLYLFSWDAELSLDRDNLGSFRGGVHMNLYARPSLTSVYNVARESTVAGLGSAAVTGTMVWGGDQVQFRADDTIRSQIRVIVKTDDGAIIDVQYAIVGFPGLGSIRRIVSGKKKDRIGTEDKPVDVPITTSPRFHSAHPRYRWLNELQGIGFANVEIINSNFRRTTCDIYAFT